MPLFFSTGLQPEDQFIPCVAAPVIRTEVQASPDLIKSFKNTQKECLFIDWLGSSPKLRNDKKLIGFFLNINLSVVDFHNSQAIFFVK